MEIIKVPGLNNLNKNNGCRNAGNAILAELSNIWTNEKGKIIDSDNLNIEEIHLDNQNLDEQEELIYKNSFEAFENNEKVIFLGGDHSISYSIGKAFLENCEKDKKEACMIVFDAHADCMKVGKNPTHEEWLRALIEKGFSKENILLIGLRNLDKTERDFLDGNKIKQISVNDLNENLEETTDIIMEFANKKELYVSFDIDFVDAVFAPSTGYPEIGGVSSRQAIYIMQRIALMKNLKAVDIVEINCEEDKKNKNLTVKLGAKLLAELI